MGEPSGPGAAASNATMAKTPATRPSRRLSGTAASPPPTGSQYVPAMSRTVDLLRALTESDLRARYGRGPWRLGKWLLDPFALVGVYLLLVTVVLNRGGTAAGLSLACAVVPFQLLMLTTINGLD